MTEMVGVLTKERVWQESPTMTVTGSYKKRRKREGQNK